MNEDIRILRSALQRYRDFVEVPEGDPMEVPLYWYNSARATYAEACSPERIRRLLDDAERYQVLRNRDFDFVVEQDRPGWRTTMPVGKGLDEAIDQARKA